MNIDQFLGDEQDFKIVEKVLVKLHDLLHPDEELQYIAVQKKPAVNLLADSIVASTQRLFFCSPTHLGLTLNIKDISWRNIKEVAYKEEFFGAQFICITQQGDPIIVDYIPKSQVRKLHQIVTQAIENERKQQLEKANTINLNILDEIPEAEIVDDATPSIPLYAMDNPNSQANSASPAQDESADETTIKLRKLKYLFDQELISQAEYETKKAEILANF